VFVFALFARDFLVFVILPTFAAAVSIRPFFNFSELFPALVIGSADTLFSKGAFVPGMLAAAEFSEPGTEDGVSKMFAAAVSIGPFFDFSAVPFSSGARIADAICPLLRRFLGALLALSFFVGAAFPIQFLFPLRFA